MISRQLITFIVLLLFTTSHALKGVRGRSRQLQEEDIFDRTDKDSPTDLKEDGTPKEDTSKGVEKDDKNDDKKEDKKDEKSDKKGDKKGDKKKDDKKCKKRPKTVEAPKESPEDKPAAKMSTELSDDEDTTAETKALDDELAVPPEPKEADSPWCEDASIKKSGDCQALAAGNFPNSSEVVTGYLALEVTSKKDNIVEAMERKLTEETSLTAVGCGGRRLENATDVNVTEVFLLAVDISGLSANSEDCTNSNITADASCTVMSSDVVIHYSGEATADQKIALFDSLTNTILSQAKGGDFDDIASVHYAEAKIAGEEDTEGFSSPKASDPGSAGIIGGVLAAVAAAVVVAGVVVYKKKKNADGEGCGPATVQPSDRQVIHVLSDDVEIVNATVF